MVRLWPPNPAINVLAVVIGTLLIAALSQLSLPLPGEATWNGQMVGVLLTAGLLGAGRGLIALLIYLVGGVAGIPWLPGFTSGFGLEQAGPVISIFIGLTLLVGLAADNGWLRTLQRVVMVTVGTVVAYYVLLWAWLLLLNSSDEPNAQGGVIARAATDQLLEQISIAEAITAGLFLLVMAIVYQGLLPRRERSRAVRRADSADALGSVPAPPLDTRPRGSAPSASSADRTAPTQAIRTQEAPAATTAQHRRTPPVPGSEGTPGRPSS